MELIIKYSDIAEWFQEIERESIFLFDKEMIEGLDILTKYYFNYKSKKYIRVELDLDDKVIFDIFSIEIEPTPEMIKERNKIKINNF
jgi:hypothetical protein